jgi:hypothetical protein
MILSYEQEPGRLAIVFAEHESRVLCYWKRLSRN